MGSMIPKRMKVRLGPHDEVGTCAFALCPGTAARQADEHNVSRLAPRARSGGTSPAHSGADKSATNSTPHRDALHRLHMSRPEEMAASTVGPTAILRGTSCGPRLPSASLLDEPYDRSQTKESQDGRRPELGRDRRGCSGPEL
jgi:hypothetical protein